MDDRLGVAVVGAGYWGPNVVRNLSSSDDWDVRWVCDLDQDRARGAVGRYSTVGITGDIETVLADPSVDAVVVATPASTHAEIGLACLETGRHVLMEKPLAASLAAGEKLVRAARAEGLVLMADHTYCYTPAVERIRDLIAEGALGDIHYVDSVRVNLGLVQPDIDVVWDLAPHDLSILDHVLPAGRRPVAVTAHAADPVGAGKACLAYLAIELAGGALAHIHVNWLSPVKGRRVVIGGSERMLVWDDLDPVQRVSLYDRGVDLRTTSTDDRRAALVGYRTGEMVAPPLPEREALTGAVAEFARAIRSNGRPRTDGDAALRVLTLLEAASASLATGSSRVALEDR